jgi:Primase X
MTVVECHRCNKTMLTINTFTISGSRQELERQVANGLDIITSLLSEPLWPRTISTKTTEGRQVKVSSKQQAMAWYKAAKFLDCRISAYPCDYLGKVSNRQTVDLVMIDLDRSIFKSRQSLDRAQYNTLKKIRETFGIEFEPSRIWSGNGYHIYIPIESCYVLEERPEFNKFDEPSKRFLRFAEWHLSNGKADSNHFRNVSLGNCMLRIPGSHNSKRIIKNNNVAGSSTQVRIIQQWNGERRAPIYLLIGSFLAYLVDQKFREDQQRKQQFSKCRHIDNESSNRTIIVPWIEMLIKTPIDDYRKTVIRRILPRYLINKKGLTFYDAFNVIDGWLRKCNSLRRLDSNINYRLKDNLNYAIKSGRLPISLATLKSEEKGLYDIIVGRQT